MGALTGFLTLNASSSPKDADACLLSDILMEITDVQPRFYLSQKACRGILRRATRRGKTLPPLLDPRHFGTWPILGQRRNNQHFHGKGR